MAVDLLLAIDTFLLGTGAVHIDLKEYHHYMMSGDEVIVGPVVEYIVEGGGTFNEPVQITIPHCVRPDKTSNLRVLCGMDRVYRVS